MVGGAAEARLLAARLGAEGVVWELRGGIDGPYPLGPVQVYVDEADYETARDVLALEHDSEPASAGRAPLALWFVLLAIVALAVFAVARVAAGSGMGTPPARQPVPTEAP